MWKLDRRRLITTLTVSFEMPIIRKVGSGAVNSKWKREGQF